jgi:mono/diheme cytochrome c family protein
LPGRIAPEDIDMRMLLAVVALHLVTMGAQAQPFGDAAAGRRLAETECGACHAVGPGGAGAARGGPAFADIATMPSATHLSLHAFLRQPHPPMPHLVLRPAELDDVVAYILSLRGDARR